MSINIHKLTKKYKQVSVQEKFPHLPLERMGAALLPVAYYEDENGNEVKHSLLREAKKSFVFNNMDAYRRMRSFMHSNSTGLWISGPTGAGKSDAIRFYLSSTGIPYMEINGFSKLEEHHLVGRIGLKTDKGTYFQYGPLVKAMLYGIPLIIHEGDLISTEIFVALNKVLEGGSIELLDNGGQIIEPKEGFKLIITANTGGHGDPFGQYSRKTMDASIIRRFIKMEYGYPDKETEKNILTDIFITNCDEKTAPMPIFIEAIVSFAEKARKTETGIPVSTGSLITVMEFYPMFSGISMVDKQSLKAFNIILDMVFTGGMPKEEKVSFYTLFDASLNNDMKTALSQVWEWSNSVEKQFKLVPGL